MAPMRCILILLIFLYNCHATPLLTEYLVNREPGAVKIHDGATEKTKLKSVDQKLVIKFRVDEPGCKGPFVYCYGAQIVRHPGQCPSGMCELSGKVTTNTLAIGNAEQSSNRWMLNVEINSANGRITSGGDDYTLLRDLCDPEFSADGEFDFQVLSQAMGCQPEILRAGIAVVEEPTTTDSSQSASAGTIAVICIVIAAVIVVIVIIIVGIVYWRKRKAKEEKLKNPPRDITKDEPTPVVAKTSPVQPTPEKPTPQPSQPPTKESVSNQTTTPPPQTSTEKPSQPTTETKETPKKKQKSKHSVIKPVREKSAPMSIQKASGAVTSRVAPTDESHEDVSVSDHDGVTPLKQRPIRRTRASKRDSYREVLEEIEDVFESLERWKMITTEEKIALKQKYPLKSVKYTDKREIFMFIESTPIALKLMLRLMHEADQAFGDAGYARNKAASQRVLEIANDPNASTFLQMRLIALEEYKLFDTLPRALNNQVKRLSIQAKFVYLLLECHDKEFRGQLLLNIKAHANAQLGPMPAEKKQASLYPLRVIVEANYIVNDANEKGFPVPSWRSEKTKSKSNSVKV